VKGGLAFSHRARVQRGESATARCASTGNRQTPFLFLNPFSTELEGVAQGCPLLRATFSPAQPRARRDALLSQASITHLIDPSKLACFLLLAGGTHVGLRAAVERGPSQGARSGSTGPAWVPPAYPSEAARCASTEDHQPPSPPLFREQEDDQAALPLSNWRLPLVPGGG
jgi:hypothetical protein